MYRLVPERRNLPAPQGYIHQHTLAIILPEMQGLDRVVSQYSSIVLVMAQSQMCIMSMLDSSSVSSGRGTHRNSLPGTVGYLWVASRSCLLSRWRNFDCDRVY